MDPQSVDAINSISYCYKLRAGDDISSVKNKLMDLYRDVWKID